MSTSADSIIRRVGPIPFFVPKYLSVVCTEACQQELDFAQALPGGSAIFAHAASEFMGCNPDGEAGRPRPSRRRGVAQTTFSVIRSPSPILARRWP